MSTALANDGLDVSVLRLDQMIAQQKGSLARRLIHAIISIAIRVFFRRIEICDAHLVPVSGPVIFVMNHPNGLIDPALVFCALPRRISFLAKSTLFRLPVLGWLLRTVDALPVYRRIDRGEDLSLNSRTFEACHRLLRQDRCIALFPEGVSHNSPQLLPLKTGAARIALGTLACTTGQPSEPTPATINIVPVGLYYTSKTTFRSEVLLRFGESIPVSPAGIDEQHEPPRAEVRQLSARIEAGLRAVTLNVESTEALEEVTRAEQLFSSFYEGLNFRQSLAQTFSRLRRIAEGRQVFRNAAPARIERLRDRIEAYEAEMREIGIAPENLSLATHSPLYIARHFVLRTLLIAILSPLAIVGAVIHYPAYRACEAAARYFQRHGEDDIVSTAKIMSAIVLMPLTWGVVALASYYWLTWRAIFIFVPAAITCGYVAMRVLEELYEMRGWFRGILVLLRRRGLFLRLLIERQALRHEMEKLGITLEKAEVARNGETVSRPAAIDPE